jgi:signal transduction histidine kinase
VIERRGRPDVAALWLTAQQEIADRAAHELRNSLNGVAVNLEVVRSRLQRKTPDMAAIAPFAETASGAMEDLSALAEAFLTLARPARQPADVGSILKCLFTVLEPLARRAHEDIRFRPPPPGDGVTGAPADVTRLVLASVTLEALKRPASVSCAIEAVDEGRFAVTFAGWFPIQLPDAILHVARGANILPEGEQGDGARVTFPAFRG